MKLTRELEDILETAKDAALAYYKLTEKPLGITGEYGEYLAAKHLGLDLAEARQSGWDATDDNGRKIQIKSRKIPVGKKLGSQRVGGIKSEYEWDVVVLVVMDDEYAPQSMHEAERGAIEEALNKPGSKARNVRRSMAASQFIKIARQVWPSSS